MTPRRVPQIELSAGYEIPRIVNGCWQLARDHRSAKEDPRASADGLWSLASLGLTTFDCADIYTGVEERLGIFRRSWKSQGRDPSLLRFHTKFVPDIEVLPRINSAYVERIVSRSRHRLGVDHLNLVQFHWWDLEVPGWVETARSLDALRRTGEIARLGVTNFDALHLGRLLDAGIEIVSNQVQYSLLDRRPERGTADLCKSHGIALLTYGTLAGGFLTDRWLGQPDPGLQGGNRSLTKYRLIIDELGGWDAFQQLLFTLDRVAVKHKVSVANVATRWVLDRPGVAAVILGASTAAHGEDNLRCFDVSLDPEDHERIGRHLAQHPGPPGDVYSVEREPSSRHAAIMKTNLNGATDKATGQSHTRKLSGLEKAATQTTNAALRRR